MRTQQEFQQFKAPSLQDDLLKVGSAETPQVMLIAGFAFLLVLIISISMATIFYADASKIAKREQIEETKENARLAELLVLEIYRRAKQEILFFSNTPPIQGIIRGLRNNDEREYQRWVESFNLAFTQKLQSDPTFSSMSYIRLNDVNSPILTVFRQDSQILRLQDNQSKPVTNPELLSVTNGRQGQVHFLSSYSGRDKISEKSFFEVAIPIYDQETHKVFGLLKFELDLDVYLNSLKLEQLIRNNIYIARADGTIIYQHAESQYSHLQNAIGSSMPRVFPGLTSAINNNLAQYWMNGDEDLLADVIATDTTGKKDIDTISPSKPTQASGFLKKVFLPSDETNALLLFIQPNYSQLAGELLATERRVLVVSFILAIIALILSVLVSRRVTRPLNKIIHALTDFGYTGHIGELPTNAKDESGVLARSFHNMFVVKARQEQEIMQIQKALDEHAIVSITDVRGNILRVNDKFVEVSGYSSKELIGQNHRVLNSGYHGLDFFKSMYQTIARGGIWQAEICNRAKNGELYWVNTTIVPFMNSDGKPERYVSIRTDISATKEANKLLAATKDELAHRLQLLQEANEELDQFAYVASHDLKSPLNGIAQLANWLEEDCGKELSDESLSHLSLLKSRSKRMMALLNDLLQYSRIGRKQHPKEKIYLKTIVDDIFEMSSGNEHFVCEAPNQMMIVARPPFELVIRNFISNAIKHHDKASGRIEFSLLERDEFYVLRVQDDGPGIPVDLQQKAMEMFQTLQSRDKVEGSGMGLAIINKTVNHLGGSLTIESDGRRGTCFIVKWPIGTL